jgi:hypothetical protein
MTIFGAWTILAHVVYVLNFITIIQILIYNTMTELLKSGICYLWNSIKTKKVICKNCQKCIDTGVGLERIAVVMQNVHDNYV